jgi:hypothetical protein
MVNVELSWRGGSESGLTKQLEFRPKYSTGRDSLKRAEAQYRAAHRPFAEIPDRYAAIDSLGTFTWSRAPIQIQLANTAWPGTNSLIARLTPQVPWSE